MRVRIMEDGGELDQVLANDSDRLDSTDGQHPSSSIVILIDRSVAIPVDRLAAEIQQALDRAATSPDQTMQVLDVSINFAQRTAWVGGKALYLTGTEFELLALLARRAGQAVSRQTILEAVWGPDRSTKSLNVHMSALRAKLKRPGLIETVHGFGYRFGEPALDATEERHVHSS